MPRKYAQVDIPEDVLRHLYCEQKWTQEQIADQYGCSITVIKSRMKKYGIVTRMQSPNVSEHDLRRLYFEEKLTQAEIAIQLGSSQSAIYRVMKRFGITDT